MISDKCIDPTFLNLLDHNKHIFNYFELVNKELYNIAKKNKRTLIDKIKNKLSKR